MSARTRHLVASLTLALFGAAAHAGEAAAVADPLTGKGELGYLATSGNSDTSSLNAKLALTYELATLRHGFTAAAVKAEDSGVVTAERYQVGYQFDYKFDEHDYLFATVNWEQDEFAGFTARTSEAFGYGRRKLIAEVHHLALEVGVGARQTDFILTPDTDETIVRLLGKYQWRIAEGTTFDQSVTVEKGDENTYSESVTALASKLNGALSLKVSYTVKNNSEVGPGLEETDTYTAVGVEYTF